MKLTIDRDALFRALGHAAGVIERKETIPILANVLIEAEGAGAEGSVRVTTTNLNQQFSRRIAKTLTDGEGAVTVGAHLLHDMLREMPAGSQAELETADGRLNVRNGRSRYKIAALPRDDFPVMDVGEPRHAMVLEAKDLAKALASVGFAQHTEVDRPYLCGVHVEVEDGGLVVTATNGNCLATRRIPLAEAPEEFPGETLPAKVVAELTKALADAEGKVRLTFGPGKVAAEVGDSTIVSKLIDGTYPDWRRVVPSQNGKRLAIGAASFAGAVRRARVVANEKTRAVRLDLDRDKLTVSVASPENGTATEEAPAAYDAEPMSIGFNARFLLDTIAASGGEEMHVDFADGAAPTLFTNPADSAAQWVVMPMRV